MSTRPIYGVGGFIDIETTGLDPAQDEVIEFSIVLFRFNRETGEIVEILDEYTGQREPNRSIPKEATAIHGLTKHQLKGKTLDTVRIQELASKCEFFVAHNAEFDRSFLDLRDRPWYCSMRGINWRQHGFKSRKLQSLLKAHGIDPGQAHRAASDVHAAIKLLSMRNPKGQPYLKELLSHGPAFPAEAPVHQEAAASKASTSEAPEKAKGCAASLAIGLAVPASIVILWQVV